MPSAPHNQPATPAHARTARRAVGLAVLIVGSITCFVWADHALANGPLWQLAACAVLWILHSLLVCRLWSSTEREGSKAAKEGTEH